MCDIGPVTLSIWLDSLIKNKTLRLQQKQPDVLRQMWSERRLHPGQAEKLDKRNILSQKKFPLWSGEEETLQYL